MPVVESELGTTHLVDMDGIMVFGASASEIDARAEENDQPVEVIHLNLARRAFCGVNADSPTNPDQ